MDANRTAIKSALAEIEDVELQALTVATCGVLKAASVPIRCIRIKLRHNEWTGKSVTSCPHAEIAQP